MNLGKNYPLYSFDNKEALVNIKSTFDILYTVDVNSYSGKDEIQLNAKRNLYKIINPAKAGFK